jgi:hypothetical protein
MSKSRDSHDVITHILQNKYQLEEPITELLRNHLGSIVESIQFDYTPTPKQKQVSAQSQNYNVNLAVIIYSYKIVDVLGVKGAKIRELGKLVQEIVSQQYSNIATGVYASRPLRKAATAQQRMPSQSPQSYITPTEPERAPKPRSMPPVIPRNPLAPMPLPPAKKTVSYSTDRWIDQMKHMPWCTDDLTEWLDKMYNKNR